MNNVPMTRRQVWLLLFLGSLVGGWIQRFASARHYEHKAKELEEDKRTHIACKVTLPDGSEASYAIRSDSAEDVEALIHASVATLTANASAPKESRPVTVNLTITGQDGSPPNSEEIAAVVKQAVQFSDLSSGRPLTVSAAGDQIGIVDEYPGIPTTPATSAEAREYLEHDRWAGA